MRSLMLSVAIALSSIACAGVGRPVAATAPPPAAATMWIEPANVADHDLFNGPWGADNAPDPNSVYKLKERKHTGVNLGMTVVDAKGREWSVKQPYPGGLDPEGPVEVVVSRLLSGIGYHQPPVYYLEAFRLKDDFGTHVEVGGRFRLKTEQLKEAGFWKWEDNPFVGRREYQALIVLLTMFNGTDLKNSNNSLYEYRDGDLVQQWYVARDIGASLGDANPLAPRKGYAPAFEKTPFVLGVNENGFVVFGYDGWYRNLREDRITPEEVAWACSLLGRLSDAQFRDAFRAGGFAPDRASRFIAKLREKIDQGRALGTRVAAK